ncbi:hypothetical protein BGZ73_004752 [Actinomortierella ambigua]|nr:hypothetical protein BGZ73_004752 [Actinomortierella ambigua]
MHSKLDLHAHMECVDFIVAFDECHRSSFIGRYLGKCNSLKQAMNDCLQREFDKKRKEKFEAAKERRRRVEKAWEGMDD